MRNTAAFVAILAGLGSFFLVASAEAQEGPVQPPAQPPPLNGPQNGNPQEGPVQGPQHEEATVFERHPGFEGGARLGVALPFGKFDGRDKDDEKISEFISATVPIWLDAGYRFNGRWYVGAYAIIAPGITNGSNCTECSAANYKLGINGHLHFIPEGPLDPYIGFGAGYDVVTLSRKNVTLQNAAGQTALGTVDLTAKGWQIANLQFGMDIRVTNLVRIRPFLSLGLDVTTKAGATIGSTTTEVTDLDTTVHEWLSFGVGGVLNP